MAYKVIGKISVMANENGIIEAADELKHQAGEYLRHIDSERYMDVLITVPCDDNNTEQDS